jgi:phosphatidylglycerol lysyltransferase
VIDAASEKRLQQLLARCGHSSHTHLFYLGDKQLFWDSRGEAVIFYRLVGKKRMVLGDPLGTHTAAQRVIRQFIADCLLHKHAPVFYQIKSPHMELYRSFGLQPVKIGEEALVELPEFHTNGKQWLKLRNRMSKVQRSGYTFEVLHPPYSETLLNRLQSISDEWLSNRKEKSFSVGSFSRDYISRFPVAVLISPGGSCEAFVSFGGSVPLPVSHGQEAASRQITIDLMRYTGVCPHGAMEVLFVSLFLWAKERGYRQCSLGIAPLANVDHVYLIKLIYKYGNRMYNFKGLYEYKNKFAPHWDNVYIACPPASLPLNLALLALIIHRPSAYQLEALQDKPLREAPPLRKRA